MAEMMTRADRETLIKIARQRERVAKSEARERAANLIADFEKQLDRRYSYDENAVWDEATEIANKAVKDANARIAEECARLGIPAQFAPGLNFSWYSLGRNSVASERSEMRRIANRQIEALEQQARTSIERQSLETQEKIMVGGLTSDDARRFLESMPTVSSLMPELSIDRVETLMIESKTP